MYNRTSIIVPFVVLFVLLVTANISSAQTGIYYDTLILVEPRYTKQDSLFEANTKDYIDITTAKTRVFLNGTSYYPKNNNELDNLLNNKRKKKKKYGIRIFANTGTEPKRLTDILLLLKKMNVQLYSIERPGNAEKKHSPIAVRQPVESQTTIVQNDSATLAIHVLADSLKVSFLNIRYNFKEPAQLDRFILQHTRSINPDKVIVSAPANLNFSKLSPVLELIKKHAYYRFKLVTTQAE